MWGGGEGVPAGYLEPNETMETNHQYSILSFQLKDFETSIARFLLSFFLSKAQKVKYLSHLLINHPCFLVNLPMVFIYKFYKKNNLNPTTRRTSRTSSW